MSRDPTIDGSKRLKNKNHEKVAQLYINKTGNDYECYQKVYGCQLKAAKVNMSKLLTKANFKARVDFLNKKHVDKALWTREMALKELKEILELSKEAKVYNSSISAIKELNTLEDIYPKEEKTDILKVEIIDD